jgi:hypothetical protein
MQAAHLEERLVSVKLLPSQSVVVRVRVGGCVLAQ